MPIRQSDLAQLLGVTVAGLERVLDGVRPIGRGEPKYRWRDLSRVVSRQQMAEAIRAERQRRMNTRTSRRWLAGYPRLVAEWHPTRNVDLFPDQVSYGSQRYIWWKCSGGPDHEWRARAAARVVGDGCPFCAGQRVSLTNCLATRAPEIARQWHPTRNRGLTPSDVVWSSGKTCWWKCVAAPDHEWPARINSRTSGRSGCPSCAGRRLSVTNSLAALAPSIAAEWHPTRNGKLRPSGIVAYSTRPVWWHCKAAVDHVWRDTPSTRVSHQRGCPFCAGHRVASSNSLASRAPEVAREWHPTRNRNLTPSSVTAGSHRTVWWRCAVDASHEWRAAILNRARNHARKGSGCPFCQGRRPPLRRSR